VSRAYRADYQIILSFESKRAVANLARPDDGDSSLQSQRILNLRTGSARHPRE
jgi:hypothetical protein